LKSSYFQIITKLGEIRTCINGFSYILGYVGVGPKAHHSSFDDD